MIVDRKPVWRIFPGLNDELAYYDSLGNYIALNTLSQEQLRAVHTNPSANARDHSIVIHEFQHWSDHMSTLWGQKKLQKTFRAFDAAIRRDESLFYRMKEAFDDFRRDRLFDYYTEQWNSIQGDAVQKWRYVFSAGSRFDHTGHVTARSIPFVRFFSYKDEPIARVPLSVASLLETTARYSETAVRLSHILALPEPDRTLEMNELRSELIRYIYHPEFTLYSVAVHACSNILHIKDIITGYRIAAQFATLALNIPQESLQSFKIPADYENWGNNYSQNMIAQQDYGFLFLCLVKNYADLHSDYDRNTFSIDAVLESSGLPDIQTLEQLIDEESMQIDAALVLEGNIFMNLVLDKQFTGNQIRHATGIALEKENVDENFLQDTREKPYFICNDDYFTTDAINFEAAVEKVILVQPISREEWWCIFETCEKRMNLFCEICGV